MQNDIKSRSEKILSSIIENKSYTDEPLSKIEELFLCLKYGITDVAIPENPSEVEMLLFSIIHKIDYYNIPYSRVGKILLSILYNTDYDNLPYSELEKLLLSIKNIGIWNGSITVNDSSILGICRLGIMKLGKV